MRDGRPSSTALLVAKATVIQDLRRDGFAPPIGAADVCRQFFEATTKGRRFLRRVEEPWYRLLATTAERLTIPGLFRHYAWRKRRIEEAVRAAIDDGIRLVVNVGAGLDTLTLRLHREHPTVLFAEIDHPQTQRAKRNVFESGTGHNLEFHPADLNSHDLEALQFDKPAIVVLESVLMYLEPTHVRRLFATLRRRLPPGSRIVFTFMEAPRFRRQSILATTWLTCHGEPFRWQLRPDRLPDFLLTRGLRGSLMAEFPDSTRGPVAQGEHLAIAVVEGAT